MRTPETGFYTQQAFDFTASLCYTDDSIKNKKSTVREGENGAESGEKNEECICISCRRI